MSCVDITFMEPFDINWSEVENFVGLCEHKVKEHKLSNWMVYSFYGFIHFIKSITDSFYLLYIYIYIILDYHFLRTHFLEK
jgi:hypothetical protein